MDLPSSVLFQAVLSGGTASNVKIFDGLPRSSYTMGQWEKICEVLEAEAQQTLMMSSEGIRTSKVGVIKMNKRTMTFTGIAV